MNLKKAHLHAVCDLPAFIHPLDPEKKQKKQKNKKQNGIHFFSRAISVVIFVLHCTFFRCICTFFGISVLFPVHREDCAL